VEIIELGREGPASDPDATPSWSSALLEDGMAGDDRGSRAVLVAYNTESSYALVSVQSSRETLV
jgi:hypothetical protein